jgi:hypothetical protein
VSKKYQISPNERIITSYLIAVLNAGKLRGNKNEIITKMLSARRTPSFYFKSLASFAALREIYPSSNIGTGRNCMKIKVPFSNQRSRQAVRILIRNLAGRAGN